MSQILFNETFKHINQTFNQTKFGGDVARDPLNSMELIFSWWMTLSCLLGTGLSVWSVWNECLCQTNRNNKGYLNSIMGWIFCTDFVWMMSSTMLFGIQSIQQRFLWTFSCWYIPFSSVLFASSSCMTMTYLAFERYRIIVLEQRISLRSMIGFMSLIWALALVMGTFPLWNLDLDHVQRSPTGVFCMNQWYLDVPTMKAHSAICVSTLLASLMCTCFCYVAIYKKYRSVSGQVRVLSSTETLNRTLEEERTVTRKLVWMVGGFVSCWVLYFFVMMLQLATNQPSNGIYEFIATWLVFSTPTCNSCIFATSSSSFEWCSRCTYSCSCCLSDSSSSLIPVPSSPGKPFDHSVPTSPKATHASSQPAPLSLTPKPTPPTRTPSQPDHLQQPTIAVQPHPTSSLSSSSTTASGRESKHVFHFKRVNVTAKPVHHPSGEYRLTIQSSPHASSPKINMEINVKLDDAVQLGPVPQNETSSNDVDSTPLALIQKG